ncbi:MAG: SWIM zinc finger family protein, partial [Cyanobacteria bacterium P01_H01_bin.105]
TDKSFSRGQSYWKSGAVVSLTQRQNTLQSEVEGNEALPYRITVDFDSGGITRTHCSCPYSFEGWCKHIVATLIACIEQPDTIEQRATLAQLLDSLNLVQTQGLVQKLVEENPALIESVDFYVSRSVQPFQTQAATKSKRPQRQTSIDQAVYRRRVREIIRTTVQHWEYGGEDDGSLYELNDVAEDALTFLEVEDGHNALSVMEAITDACVSYWGEVYDMLGMGPDEFALDLDAVWTEAILSTDLTTDETLEWQEKLGEWQTELGSFSMALEALRQGWDYPPLVRVLQGEISELGAWSGEAPSWADSFSQVRLKILQRQERYEEYLYLAQAEGHMEEYLAMLGQLGRTDEAVDEAAEVMTTLSEAKALAEILRAQNKLAQALDIAIQGLRFEADRSVGRYDFAVWTSELAAGLDEQETALEARVIAFQAQPSLQEYQTVESLASDWPETRAMLLTHLRAMDEWMARESKVDIFLYEGLVEDAIATVSPFAHSLVRPKLVMRVMDAAIASHSHWVIKIAKREAETIMDAGKAKDYDIAVSWLQRVQRAYLAQNEDSTWYRYSQKLVSKHIRKRKLTGLMKDQGWL